MQLVPSYSSQVVRGKRSVRDGSKVPVGHVVSGLPAQDRSPHQWLLRNSDCHIRSYHDSDKRHQNTDDHHRFLTQNCGKNHCRNQPAYDSINIDCAFGRNFYAKEDIDASLDSTNDHVMHWTCHICNIHYY